ncbi:MAG: bifunctional 2-polyprenyl-6-hydroxyphenol methylase/3-demethylubiquinol 3-O-methyltransferase UbiG [Gammaproteobacteria bacterium]|nr:bifunctional 2-polyprenyl-6-hydroxyphenol methylase/3-demethylubiquinol 3-O-methyltransferase UbiG [Gammaproteobacteria bacterium]
MVQTHNADPAELTRFEAVAHHWWDLQGPLKTLHGINPLRLQYITERATLAGARVLDVGCGGGILSEALARQGAEVTGIDLAHEALLVARLHAAEEKLSIDYREMAVEQLAGTEAGRFDVVTCLEMLEHVPDPASVVTACARLVKPGGQVFFSTINRNPRAWLMAVLGAEYLLNIIPRGTHEYARFIQPAELGQWIRAAGLALQDVHGVRYIPFLEHYTLTAHVDVNYLVWAQRP